jgi:outer membrane protein assembly factor BamB
LMCMTLDGEIKWRTKEMPDTPMFDKGNLLQVDGMIVALDGKTGVLHLIGPSPEGYKELAQAPMLGGKEIWAPMALSDGKLVLRDQGQMKCLDLRNL